MSATRGWGKGRSSWQILAFSEGNEQDDGGNDVRRTDERNLSEVWGTSRPTDTPPFSLSQRPKGEGLAVHGDLCRIDRLIRVSDLACCRCIPDLTSLDQNLRVEKVIA